MIPETADHFKKCQRHCRIVRLGRSVLGGNVLGLRTSFPPLHGQPLLLKVDTLAGQE